MATTGFVVKDFKGALLSSFIATLTDEYRRIVADHKKEIDREFDMVVARKVTDLSVFLSEKLSIQDIGSSIKIEIYKPSK